MDELDQFYEQLNGEIKLVKTQKALDFLVKKTKKFTNHIISNNMISKTVKQKAIKLYKGFSKKTKNIKVLS